MSWKPLARWTMYYVALAVIVAVIAGVWFLFSSGTLVNFADF